MARERVSDRTSGSTGSRANGRDRDEEHTRGRGRSSTSTGSSSTTTFAPIDFDPDKAEKYGGFSGGEERVVDVWYAPMFFGDYRRPQDHWQVQRGEAEAGTLVGTIAQFTVYQDLDTGEEYTDSFPAFDFFPYAPAVKNADGTFSYAGGYSPEDFLDIHLGRVEEIPEDMKGTYVLPLPAFGGAKKEYKSNQYGSNSHFYSQSLKTAADAESIKIPFGPDIASWLIGVEGKVEKLKNTLAKKGSEINVFTVVYKRDAAGGGDAASTRSTKTRTRDEAPAASTTARGRNNASAAASATTDDDEPKPAASGRGRKPAITVTEEELDTFESVVQDVLSRHGKPLSKDKLARLVISEDDMAGLTQKFFHVVEQPQYAETFWKASDKWEFDPDSEILSPAG